MYNKEGVSAIIINTDLGIEVFHNIKDNLEYKDCELDKILSGNPSLKVSSKRPIKRDDFFNELDNMSTNDLTKKYQNKVSLFRIIKNKIKCLIKRIIKK